MHKKPGAYAAVYGDAEAYGQYWFVTITPYGKLEVFEKMAAALFGYTKSCIISFIDIYKKVERNLPNVREAGIVMPICLHFL